MQQVSRRSFLSGVCACLTTGPLSAHAGDILETYSNSSIEHQLLKNLLLRSLQYFIDNSYGKKAAPLVRGFTRDRQNNFGELDEGGDASTSATGMSFIAKALASDPEYHLLSPKQAIVEIQLALETALLWLERGEAGIGPHFVDANGNITGRDKFSTIDWSWLLIGAGWAAHFLQSPVLKKLFEELYRRADWRYWTHGSESGQLRHGRHENGSLLYYCWDHFNSEDVAMYVLATGAEENYLPATVWRKLKPFRVNGIASGDLGLFAHQLGLELFSAEKYLTAITGVNLLDEHRKAVDAHLRASQENKCGGFWGYSAGDNPSPYYNENSVTGNDGTVNLMSSMASISSMASLRANPSAVPYYQYKENSVTGNDGTVNLTVANASLRVNKDAVMRNIKKASEAPWAGQLMGRYGLANINLSRPGKPWISKQAVGIDVGGAVLSIANFLRKDLIRAVFEDIPFVRTAIQRIREAG
jgi:hypothetical protein